MREKLEQIMIKMEDIQYGFIKDGKNIYPEGKEWDNSFSTHYYLQLGQDILKSKCGVCWDQVELERYYLKEYNIDCQSYFIVEYDGKQFPTHTFMVIKEDKYYWFEHSWERHRGIYEYSDLKSLLLDVKNKFKLMLNEEKISSKEIVIYAYSEPIKNLNCQEFYNHCEQGEKIEIDE